MYLVPSSYFQLAIIFFRRHSGKNQLNLVAEKKRRVAKKGMDETEVGVKQ